MGIQRAKVRRGTVRITGLLFDSAEVALKSISRGWISGEFDAMIAEGDGYFLIVDSGTSAIFRHGYSTRYGI